MKDARNLQTTGLKTIFLQLEH